MFLGHFALGDMARNFFVQERGAWLLIPAAYGPDLVDKPLRMLFGLQGRGAGHTLIFFLAMLLVASLAWGRLKPGARRLVLCGGLLWALHLVCDLCDPAIVFWPLLGDLPPADHLSLSELLRRYFGFYLGRGRTPELVLDLACLTAMIAMRAAKWSRREAPGLAESKEGLGR